MPAGVPFTPGTWPALQVFGFCLDPQRKIQAAFLEFLSAQVSGIIQHLFQIPATQLGIGMIFSKFLYVKEHIAIHLIRIPTFQNSFGHLDLLNDMSGSGWFNIRWQGVELRHDVPEGCAVFLHDLHRLHLFQPGLFRDAVAGSTCCAFYMSGIGDVAHIPDLITQVTQVAVDHIKRHEGAAVAQVRFAVHGRAAHIHTYKRGMQWPEDLFASGRGIIDQQFILVEQFIGHGTKIPRRL